MEYQINAFNDFVVRYLAAFNARKLGAGTYTHIARVGSDESYRVDCCVDQHDVLCSQVEKFMTASKKYFIAAFNGSSCGKISCCALLYPWTLAGRLLPSIYSRGWLKVQTFRFYTAGVCLVCGSKGWWSHTPNMYFCGGNWCKKMMLIFCNLSFASWAMRSLLAADEWCEVCNKMATVMVNLMQN